MAVILDGASGGIQLTSTSGGTASVNPPATATSYVQTLPAATGTILNSASSLAAANLTGTVVDARISALTASKLTGTVATARLGSGTASSATFLAGDQTYKTIASGGMTLLTTLNTTSGETITAGSLNLTGFKFVLITTLQLSQSSSTSQGLRFTPNTGGSYGLGLYDIPSYFKWSSVSNIELATGSYTAFLPNNMPVPSQPSGFLSAGLGNNNAFTASVTSIAFTWSAGGTFDAGSIRVYGLK